MNPEEETWLDLFRSDSDWLDTWLVVMLLSWLFLGSLRSALDLIDTLVCC